MSKMTETTKVSNMGVGKLIILIIFSFMVFNWATADRSEPRKDSYDPNAVTHSVKAPSQCKTPEQLFEAMTTQMSKRIDSELGKGKLYRFEGSHNVSDPANAERFIMNREHCFLTAGSFIVHMTPQGDIETMYFSAITYYYAETGLYETTLITMEPAGSEHQ